MNLKNKKLIQKQRVSKGGQRNSDRSYISALISDFKINIPVLLTRVTLDNRADVTA